MNLKTTSWRKLYDRNDRACAKLALRARCDTINGGALAMVWARRLNGMGSSIPANEIVGDVYSASNYTCTARWSVFECPECGSAYLGSESALNCCQGQSSEEE